MQKKRHSPAPSWVVPLLVAAVALPTFVAFWIGGRPQLGALWAAVSVAFGVALAIGGRSDTPASFAETNWTSARWRWSPAR